MEFKRRIGALACEPGISVAKLALEHRINANMVFRWRREYRAGRWGAPAAPHVAAKTPPANGPGTMKWLQVIGKTPPVHERTTHSAPSVEIMFACATVRVHGDVDPAQLKLVLECLAAQA